MTTTTTAHAHKGADTDSATNREALIMRDIVVSFPDGDSTITVLDGLDFSARRGEMTAVIGESGSGKSTLLSLAAGLIVPDSGTVTVGGTPMENLNEDQRAEVRREKIGMVFQQPNLIAALTVREQLLVMDHLRGEKPRPEVADELLAAVGLEGLESRRMAQLSGGQRQRVNIARALMAEPDLILADEPTAALDASRSKEIASLLAELSQERNVATVLVTHDHSLLDYTSRALKISEDEGWV